MRKHGEKGECPACGSPGTFDIEDCPLGKKFTNFSDSIWFNSHEKNWECHECWLK